MLFYASTYYTRRSKLEVISCHRTGHDACFEITLCHCWTSFDTRLGV